MASDTRRRAHFNRLLWKFALSCFQSIVNLSMEDWEDLKDALGITTATINHGGVADGGSNGDNNTKRVKRTC